MSSEDHVTWSPSKITYKAASDVLLCRDIYGDVVAAFPPSDGGRGRFHKSGPEVLHPSGVKATHHHDEESRDQPVFVYVLIIAMFGVFFISLAWAVVNRKFDLCSRRWGLSCGSAVCYLMA